MAENKFIKRLHGKETAKSVVEIKNTATPTMFTNMPAGDSNVFNTYSDHRGNATGVLRGTDNWKLSGSSLVPATTVYGDGRDMTGAFVVGNAGLWIDATYTFTEPKLFTPNTEWVLKLCGNGLLSDSNDTVELTMLIKFGSTMVSKTFFLPEQSFSFSEELVIDFSESVAQTIKVNAGDTMVVQVLCGDSSAQAQIYNGMTVLTALQRRVDGDVVASDKKTFDEIVEDVEDLEEYVDNTFVRLDGESIMTGPLKMRASISFQCAIAPYWDGVGFYKLNSDNSVTLMASMDADDGWTPWENNKYNMGTSSKKWKNLYLAGTAFVPVINNGQNITVPNLAGILLVNRTTATNGIAVGGSGGVQAVQFGMLGSAGSMATSYGFSCFASGTQSIAVGHGSQATASKSYAFGEQAKSTAIGAFQFGQATNSEAGSVCFGLTTDGNTTTNYKLLGSDGIVPDARISSNIARMTDVDLAANSGRMITDQGVWYAKMYAATVAPSAENGTNYADFSQVDGQGNPIIVIYERVNGAWVQSETITPPTEYDGYVPITSKIWDIAEQAGQQGGRILWNHQSKEFTPYPQIISFEDIEVTGNSTVIMPQNPSANQIVNKDYVDNHIPTGNFYHPDLFDWKWADHQLNDVQWLRADTFSWQAGSVYESAYQHLADDIDGKTLQSETIGSTTIQFYLADDGHKICPASEESNVTAIYNATGVAWYYIIDTTNERFKLPRTKFGVTGLRDNVGDYVEPELPNIRANAQFSYGTLWPTTMSGAFKSSGNHGTRARGEGGTSPVNLELDASESSPIYKDNATVQPPATQMYLYFYVGEFTQTAIENTAGLNAELFNDKVDVGHQVIAFQAPTVANNYTWYRLYADGWVEQGGVSVGSSDANYTVSLPVAMSDTNYTVLVTVAALSTPNTSNVGANRLSAFNITTSSFDLRGDTSAALQRHCWQVSGMAAS